MARTVCRDVHTAHVSHAPLSGRVVVVAGDAQALCAVAAAAVAAGALVAVVSRSLPDDTAATVRFRADPHDPGIWDRIGMHVEQHLGPVDGVATDAVTRAVVEQVFAADLARRGHGDVVTVSAEDDVPLVVTRLCGTPPAAPAPPNADARDR
jgi:hypothetical protein